ncbi:Eisosomes component [Friedmanniomyces endolithicus]|nr:Eisosomes component [Friedmanniomyces endolithicus]
MANARPILGLVAMPLAGWRLINQAFFLQASTGGISGGNANYHNPARWTYLSVCGVNNGLNYECGKAKAAQSYDPAHNFGTELDIPDAFIGTSKYFYLNRFTWSFYIIALFFAVVSFSFSVFALCARLGAYLTGMTAGIALFLQTLCAALMTYVSSSHPTPFHLSPVNTSSSAWTIQARNQFRKNGQRASIGVKGYAFTWVTFACYIIAMVLFCVGGSVGKSESSYDKKSSYFGRNKSTRSRGSFIDTESQRRVKDGYDKPVPPCIS